MSFNPSDYKVVRSPKGTFRVYSVTGSLAEATIRVMMEKELVKYAELHGLHHVVKALLRMKAIRIPIWTSRIQETVTTAYQIIDESEARHFATPDELLRKLDELGVFEFESR